MVLNKPRVHTPGVTVVATATGGVIALEGTENEDVAMDWRE